MLNEYDVHDLYDGLCEILRITTPPLLEIKKCWPYASGVAFDKDGQPTTVIVNLEIGDRLARQDVVELLTVELARAARGSDGARDVKFHALCHLFFSRIGRRYAERAVVEFHPSHYSWLAALTRGRLIARLHAASAVAAAQVRGVLPLSDRGAVELVEQLPAQPGEWLLRLADPRYLSNVAAGVGLGLMVLAIPLVSVSWPVALGFLTAGVVILGGEAGAREFWRWRCERGGPRVIVL